MSVITFTLIFGFISIFSIIAQYVALWDISPPMVFISLGLVVSALREAITSDIGWTAINREVVLTLAELTLATILVHDASTIKHSTRLAALPLRLLWIGLPLCIVATYFFVNAILPDIGISGALFLAGVLSPTDAGLGAATILNPMVPSLVRQALNVESGLNDGIVTPIVFIALAGLQSGSSGLNLSDVMKFAVIPISLAVAVAVVTGPLYALAIDFSHTHELGNAEGSVCLNYFLHILFGPNSLPRDLSLLHCFSHRTRIVYGDAAHIYNRTLHVVWRKHLYRGFPRRRSVQLLLAPAPRGPQPFGAAGSRGGYAWLRSLVLRWRFSHDGVQNGFSLAVVGGGTGSLTAAANVHCIYFSAREQAGLALASTYVCICSFLFARPIDFSCGPCIFISRRVLFSKLSTLYKYNINIIHASCRVSLRGSDLAGWPP